MVDIKSLLHKRIFWAYFILVILLISVLTPTLVIFVKRAIPIIIESDADFAKYDFPGSGTKLDPYRIENRKLMGQIESAIAIFNISKYVVIQNNHIRTIAYGIFLAVNTPGLIQIKNNIIENCLAPLWIIETRECVIKNNIIKKGIRRRSAPSASRPI